MRVSLERQRRWLSCRTRWGRRENLRPSCVLHRRLATNSWCHSCDPGRAGGMLLCWPTASVSNEYQRSDPYRPKDVVLSAVTFTRTRNVQDRHAGCATRFRMLAAGARGVASADLDGDEDPRV